MELILMLHKTRKYILTNIAFFVTFMVIYITLDINANDSYQYIIDNFGMSILVLHMTLNVLISLLSSVVITWSLISLQVNKKDVKGSNLPFVGVVLGFLTFGCTPCVVALLSIFGITFVPLVLPNANFLWKVLVLLIIILSGYLTIRNANKGCKIENN